MLLISFVYFYSAVNITNTNEISYIWFCISASTEIGPTTPGMCLHAIQDTINLVNIDGLVQKRRNSSALVMELRLSYTNPSIWSLILIPVFAGPKYSDRIKWIPCMFMSWALLQFSIRCFIVRSHEISKPRDWLFKLWHRFGSWQAHRHQCCRGACQISERSDNSKYKSRGFEN